MIMAYDTEAAGRAAQQTPLWRFRELGIDTKLFRMQGAKDPEECIRKFGAE